MDAFIDNINVTELLGDTVNRLRKLNDRFSSIENMSKEIYGMTVNRLRNIEKCKVKQISKPELTMIFRLLCEDDEVFMAEVLLDAIKEVNVKQMEQENWIIYLSERFCLGINVG